MSGVFLSYSRADRALAEQVIRALRNLGVDVWWDEDMPGVDWQEELARQINELAAVIVLWTPASASSKNVRDEARLGQHTDKLVNALVGVSSPPFPFDRVNGLPLDGWNGVDPHNGWSRLVETVEDHLAAAGAVERGRISGALAKQEQEVRAARRTMTDAEEAFRSAKADEEAASDRGDAADKALLVAQEQMRRVVEMGGSPVLVRAAQSDLDEALRANDTADAARESAAATLSAASRGLTAAKTALNGMLRDAGLGAESPPSPNAMPRPADEAPLDRHPAGQDAAEGGQERALSASSLAESDGRPTVAAGTSASAVSGRDDDDDVKARPAETETQSLDGTAAPHEAARLEAAPTPVSSPAPPKGRLSPLYPGLALVGLSVALVGAATSYFNYTFTVSDPATDPRVNWIVGNWGSSSNGSSCKGVIYQANSIVAGKIVAKLPGGETIAAFDNVVPRVRLWDGAIIIEGEALTRSSDGNTVSEKGHPVMVRCADLPAEPTVTGTPTNS